MNRPKSACGILGCSSEKERRGVVFCLKLRVASDEEQYLLNLKKMIMNHVKYGWGNL